MRRFAALAFAALLAGCGAWAAEEPPVADSTLTDVLIELHLAEARAENSTAQRLPPGTRDSVLARYELDRSTFDAAMAYYAEHPEAYVALYDGVLDSLNAERGRRLDRSRSN